MKLTNRTTPQARNYQCNTCKEIKCHKDMYDENKCNNCFDKKEAVAVEYPLGTSKPDGNDKKK